MKKMMLMLTLISLIVLTMTAQEAKLAVSKDDSMKTVLSRHVGKKVSLKLDSGEEISGTLRLVGDHVVHVEELTGKEFYDAVIDVDEIAAVIVRTR